MQHCSEELNPHQSDSDWRGTLSVVITGDWGECIKWVSRTRISLWNFTLKTNLNERFYPNFVD